MRFFIKTALNDVQKPQIFSKLHGELSTIAVCEATQYGKLRLGSKLASHVTEFMHGQ